MEKRKGYRIISDDPMKVMLFRMQLLERRVKVLEDTLEAVSPEALSASRKDNPLRCSCLSVKGGWGPVEQS